MPRPATHILSKREDAVLRLAMDGLTDIEIGDKLGISDGTVATYWGRIRTKMGPYPRTELIALCLQGEISDLSAKLHDKAAELEHLQALESMFEDVFEATERGVVVVDVEGHIEIANKAAHEIFRYEAGELVGAPLAKLMPDGMHQRHTAKIREHYAKSDGRTFRCELETAALRRDGTEVRVRIFVGALQHSDRLLLTGFIRPL